MLLRICTTGHIKQGQALHLFCLLGKTKIKVDLLLCILRYFSTNIVELPKGHLLYANVVRNYNFVLG